MPDPIPFRRPAKPKRRPAIVVLLLSVALALIYGWQAGLDAYGDMAAVLGFGLTPAELFGIRIRAPQIDGAPPIATLVTAQFLHGGVVHLGGNLLAILLAGGLVERQAGAFRMLLVFLVAGAAGLALEAAAEPTSTIPIIGASAGASALIGAALRWDPMGSFRIFLPGRGGWRFRDVPIVPLIAAWLIMQMAGLAFSQDAPIAFLAHGGGFVAGVLLGRRRRTGGPGPSESSGPAM